jgi:ComF family protein
MILDFIFPKYCIGCRRVGRYICSECFAQLEYTSHDVCPGCFRFSPEGNTHGICTEKTYLDGTLSIWNYSVVMKTVIKAVKYKLMYDIYSELLPQILEEKFDKFNQKKKKYPSAVIQPVPLYIKRERRRGFNQSEVLAQFFSKKLKLPMVSSVIKTKSTLPQAHLYSKQEREKNIQDAFEVSGEDMAGKIIILVDDVFTSGSTTNEIARILKAHNASRVFTFSLAHGSFH